MLAGPMADRLSESFGGLVATSKSVDGKLFFNGT